MAYSIFKEETFKNICTLYENGMYYQQTGEIEGALVSFSSCASIIHVILTSISDQSASDHRSPASGDGGSSQKATRLGAAEEDLEKRAARLEEAEEALAAAKAELRSQSDAAAAEHETAMAMQAERLEGAERALAAAEAHQSTLSEQAAAGHEQVLAEKAAAYEAAAAAHDQVLADLRAQSTGAAAEHTAVLAKKAVELEEANKAHRAAEENLRNQVTAAEGEAAHWKKQYDDEEVQGGGNPISSSAGDTETCAKSSCVSCEPGDAEMECVQKLNLIYKKVLGCVEQLQEALKTKKSMPASSSNKDEDGDKDWEKICTKIQPLVFSKGSSSCIFFNDLAGLVKPKQLIKDTLVKPLVYPNLYPKVGKGFLLYGPPGTGKTLIAKAAVNQLQLEDPNTSVLFFAPTGADLKGKYVGETEKKIVEFFRCASQAACVCQNKSDIKKYTSVLFIDEFDSIARDRSDDPTGLVANSVNTLLQMMDGMQSYENVAVIAATNYPWQLDSAILRRFDTQVLLNIPTSDQISKAMMIEFYSFIKLKVRGMTVCDKGKKADKGGKKGDSCRFECEQGGSGSVDITESPYNFFNYSFTNHSNQSFLKAIADEMAGEHKHFSYSDVSKVMSRACNLTATMSISNNLFYNPNILSSFRLAGPDTTFSRALPPPPPSEEQRSATAGISAVAKERRGRKKQHQRLRPTRSNFTQEGGGNDAEEALKNFYISSFNYPQLSSDKKELQELFYSNLNKIFSDENMPLIPGYDSRGQMVNMAIEEFYKAFYLPNMPKQLYINYGGSGDDIYLNSKLIIDKHDSLCLEDPSVDDIFISYDLNIVKAINNNEPRLPGPAGSKGDDKKISTINAMCINEQERTRLLAKYKLNKGTARFGRRVDIVVSFEKLIKIQNASKQEFLDSTLLGLSAFDYTKIDELVQNHLTKRLYWIIQMRRYFSEFLKNYEQYSEIVVANSSENPPPNLLNLLTGSAKSKEQIENIMNGTKNYIDSFTEDADKDRLLAGAAAVVNGLESIILTDPSMRGLNDGDKTIIKCLILLFRRELTAESCCPPVRDDLLQRNQHHFIFEMKEVKDILFKTDLLKDYNSSDVSKFILKNQDVYKDDNVINLTIKLCENLDVGSSDEPSPAYEEAWEAAIYDIEKEGGVKEDLTPEEEERVASKINTNLSEKFAPYNTLFLYNILDFPNEDNILYHRFDGDDGYFAKELKAIEKGTVTLGFGDSFARAQRKARIVIHNLKIIIDQYGQLSDVSDAQQFGRMRRDFGPFMKADLFDKIMLLILKYWVYYLSDTRIKDDNIKYTRLTEEAAGRLVAELLDNDRWLGNIGGELDSLFTIFDYNTGITGMNIARMYMGASIDLYDENYTGVLKSKSIISSGGAAVLRLWEQMTTKQIEGESMNNETFKNIFNEVVSKYKDLTVLTYIAKLANSLGVKEDNGNKIYTIRFPGTTSFMPTSGPGSLSDTLISRLDNAYKDIHGPESGSTSLVIGVVSAPMLAIALVASAPLSLTVALGVVAGGALAHSTAKRGMVRGALPILSAFAAGAAAGKFYQKGKIAQNKMQVAEALRQENRPYAPDYHPDRAGFGTVLRPYEPTHMESMGAQAAEAVDRAAASASSAASAASSAASAAYGNMPTIDGPGRRPGPWRDLGHPDTDDYSRMQLRPHEAVLNFGKFVRGRHIGEIKAAWEVADYLRGAAKTMNLDDPRMLASLVAFSSIGNFIKSMGIGDNVSRVNQYLVNMIGTTGTDPINIDLKTWNSTKNDYSSDAEILINILANKKLYNWVPSLATGIASFATMGFINYDTKDVDKYDTDDTSIIATIDDDKYDTIFGNNKSPELKKIEMEAKQKIKVIDILPSQVKIAMVDQPTSYDKDLGKMVNDYNENRMEFLQKERKKKQK